MEEVDGGPIRRTVTEINQSNIELKAEAALFPGNNAASAFFIRVACYT